MPYWEMGLASERASCVGQCCILLPLSVHHHVCRDDDDEFALLDAHDVPTLARAETGVLARSAHAPFLPQLRQRKCIRNQTLLPPSLYEFTRSPSWKLHFNSD